MSNNIGINVLSCFDGMSCGQIALDRMGVQYNNYFASEIDSNAIEVTNDNFPNTVQLGDITRLDTSELPTIDLLLGGSPCQTVSMANQGGTKSIYDGKSSLFFEYVNILNEVKPKYFLLENVKMSQENQDVISELLGVKPIVINSNLVSFQNRKRWYWTNIPNVTIPEDKGILLRDNFCVNYGVFLILKGNGVNKLNRNRNRCKSINSDKCPTLMKSQERKPTDSVVFLQDGIYRYPTRRECELMQNVPLGYTSKVDYKSAVGMLGNGWTVDVICHILEYANLPKKFTQRKRSAVRTRNK